MTTIKLKFNCKDKVRIDNSDWFVGVITYIRLHPDSLPQYNVEWTDGLTSHSACFDEFRLSHADS